MKIILSILTLMIFSGVSYADRPIKVKAKNYTCDELKQIVQEEGTVHVYGFGSLLVHSSSSACRGYEFGKKIEAYKTTWKTIDKRFCIAGYSCRRKN